MVSDIVLLKELPDVIKKSIEAYIGCLAGAMMKEDYIETIKNVGFKDVKIIDETSFPIENMANDPTAQAIISQMNIPAETLKELANSVISLKIQGQK